MSFIIPPFLKKNDTIVIVAPARKVTKAELSPAIKTIQSWGLKVVLSKNLFEEKNQFSGTDEQRTKDLQDALDNKNIKAIFCARGGYGTLRLIDKLNFTKFKKNPKWIIGFSDITVLHAHINQNLNIATMHAPMPLTFNKNKEAVETLSKSLFGEVNKYTFSSEIINAPKANKIEGAVVGGNLSLLYAMQGSSSQVNTKNRIVFIEDLDEYLYHIDRMVLSLKRSGFFKGCKALLVGGMSDMKDNTIPFGKNAKEIIVDNLKELKLPILFNFPAGHIDENNTIVFGKKALITLTTKKAEFSN
ncbi:MAG: LD-carboxypeptidase [Bacteroidetes bacterium]|nr:LD-carboxypeptidase [Bacteroidota bacterium]